MGVVNGMDLVKNPHAQKQLKNLKRELYSSYMKLDTSCKMKYPVELKTNAIYQVIEEDILNEKTRLIVRDMETGKTYQNCNSVWFISLNTYYACARREDISIGKSVSLYRKKNIMDNVTEKVETSKIISLEVVSENLVNLLTENSLYITQVY